MKKLILIPCLLTLVSCAGIPPATQAAGVTLGAILASQVINTHENKQRQEAENKQLETIMQNRKLPSQ